MANDDYVSHLSLFFFFLGPLVFSPLCIHFPQVLHHLRFLLGLVRFEVVGWKFDVEQMHEFVFVSTLAFALRETCSDTPSLFFPSIPSALPPSPLSFFSFLSL